MDEAHLTATQLQELALYDVPTIANAIERLHVRDRLLGFPGWSTRCLLPELGPMLGYAVTATVDSTTPGSTFDLDAYIALFEAIERSPGPVVVVMHDVGPDPRRGCHVGDNMAAAMVALGSVGMVIDSGVRDLAGFRSLNFRSFGPGTVASHGNNHIVQVGIPVDVDGMSVVPGDLVAGDENGVVCIPRAIAADVAAAARQVQVEETAFQAFTREPGFSSVLLRQRLAHRAKG